MEWWVLLKRCKCGDEMIVRMHTVIYQSTVEIENVPVLYCNHCDHNEVLPEVKPELVNLIDELGSKPKQKQYQFNEVSEFARLLIEVSSKHRLNESTSTIIEERINELLDMLLLSQSLNDKAWMDDIRKRLVQLTKYSVSYHG